MEFLGIGYQEILLVFVLMLVVVGPQRMPTVAYQIGRAVRTLQKYARAVRDEFSEELDYIDEQYRGLRDEIETTSASLREEQSKLQAEIESSRASLEGDVNSSLREASSALSTGGSQTAGPAAGAPAPQKTGEGLAEQATTEADSSAGAGKPGSGGETPDGNPLVF